MLEHNLLRHISIGCVGGCVCVCHMYSYIKCVSNMRSVWPSDMNCMLHDHSKA